MSIVYTISYGNENMNSAGVLNETQSKNFVAKTQPKAKDKDDGHILICKGFPLCKILPTAQDSDSGQA
tara:strand:- start:273 stop:476 length:204 start_codon:yes stop_codon:yes gene_type:complete